MEQSLSQMTSAARMGTALGLGLDAVPSGGVVFLVGFMGCGKTTVGRRLATLLQGSFVDLDEYIERAAGRTIPDLFRLEGEAGFRRREQAALVQLCAALANDPTPWKVVALGGGTFTVEANRDCVRRNGCSVWLDVPFEVLAARIMRDGGSSIVDLSSRRRVALLETSGGLRARRHSPAGW